jgi:hypothetical protein
MTRKKNGDQDVKDVPHMKHGVLTYSGHASPKISDHCPERDLAQKQPPRPPPPNTDSN